MSKKQNNLKPPELQRPAPPPPPPCRMFGAFGETSKSIDKTRAWCAFAAGYSYARTAQDDFDSWWELNN